MIRNFLEALSDLPNAVKNGFFWIFLPESGVCWVFRSDQRSTLIKLIKGTNDSPTVVFRPTGRSR
jgi:hypothetical protein